MAFGSSPFLPLQDEKENKDEILSDPCMVYVSCGNKDCPDENGQTAGRQTEGLPTWKPLTVQAGSGAGRPEGVKEAREPRWRLRLGVGSVFHVIG